MRKIKMCLLYLKYSDVISDIKALKEETITGKDFEDQAISTLALLHYWLRYWIEQKHCYGSPITQIVIAERSTNCTKSATHYLMTAIVKNLVLCHI